VLGTGRKALVSGDLVGALTGGFTWDRDGDGESGTQVMRLKFSCMSQ
jgi:hypothetical protein